jgi:amino acid transporter
VSWLIQVQVLLRFIWQCAAVILLRRYRPDIPQPFTMWLYPWPAILSGALWLFIFFTGPWEGIIFSRVPPAGVAAHGVFHECAGDVQDLKLAGVPAVGGALAPADPLT